MMYDTKTQSITNLPTFPRTIESEGIILNDYFYVRTLRGGVYCLSLLNPSKWEKENDAICNREIVSDGHYLYRSSSSSNTKAATTEASFVFKINRYDHRTRKLTTISTFCSDIDKAGATVAVGS